MINMDTLSDNSDESTPCSSQIGTNAVMKSKDSDVQDDQQTLHRGDLFANWNDMILEAQRVNNRIRLVPNLILSPERKSELYRLLRDQVFIEESFSEPFVHLYEGKLTCPIEIDEFIDLSNQYHLEICLRLKMYVKLVSCKENVEFLCKRNYGSLFELFGRRSEEVTDEVYEILIIIHDKFPWTRMELFEIYQCNLVDFNSGLRSPAYGVEETLEFVKYAFKSNPFTPNFRPNKSFFFEKVILGLFRNLNEDYAETLHKFITTYIEAYNPLTHHCRLWKLTFHYLLKYWYQAPRERGWVYASVTSDFLARIPSKQLVALNAVIFKDLEKVLKYSDAVTYETRAELRDAMRSDKVRYLTTVYFPWVADYFKPCLNFRKNGKSKNNSSISE